MSNPPQSPLASPDAWNLVSDGYVHELLFQFQLFANDAIELAALGPQAIVVDVATGPGTLALELAPAVREVRALDFAEAMIAQLGRRARDLGVRNVQATVGDGQALPFADNSFDAGFSMFGLIFFPDRAAGLRELLRVLRPGAKVVIASWAPYDRVPLMAELMRCVREALPDLPFGQGKAPLGEAAEMERELSAAGFRDVVVHERSHTLPVPSVEAFWQTNLRAMAPLVLLKNKLPTPAWHRFTQTVLKSLRQRVGEGPLEVSPVALFGVGYKP
jgi:ubiquinone/menaquinone biosynthesis C-methylase UbiE